MKSLLVIAFALCAGAVAHADDLTIGQYGQWVSLPNCGGSARLICQDVDNAKEKDLCSVEFSGVSCQNVKLFVGGDFQPNYNTYESAIQSSFFVDHNRVAGGYVVSGWGVKYVTYVNIFVNQARGNNDRYDKIQLQFAY